MDEQELKIAIALLVDQMEGDLGDRHEIFMRLHQMLDSMRAEGLPLPEDLLNMERTLDAELEAEAAS